MVFAVLAEVVQRWMMGWWWEAEVEAWKLEALAYKKIKKIKKTNIPQFSKTHQHAIGGS